MTKRATANFLLALSLLALGSCKGQALASLTAVVADPADVTGATSATANINFTKFSQPPGPGGNDSNLRMQFSDPDGNTMLIVLAPVEGSDPFPPQRYNFDGTNNTFELSFTVTSAGSPVPYNVTSSAVGYIDVSKITLENGFLKSIHAGLRMNFDNNQGTGAGDIAY